MSMNDRQLWSSCSSVAKLSSEATKEYKIGKLCKHTCLWCTYLTKGTL